MKKQIGFHQNWKLLCFKDSIKKINVQPECEEIFVNLISNKGLVLECIKTLTTQK